MVILLFGPVGLVVGVLEGVAYFGEEELGVERQSGVSVNPSGSTAIPVGADECVVNVSWREISCPLPGKGVAW
jgi:hypothetical protein